MKIVGHRGARGLAPENTLESIRQALRYSVDEIEIDVRVTKDGIPVLSHDRTLLRTAGQSTAIDQSSYAELVLVKPDLCTLSEAIECIGKKVPLNIEVKPRVATAPIVTILKNYIDSGWQPTDFLISSKRQNLLKEIHVELPDIPTGVIARFLSLWARHRARQLGTQRITMNYMFMWPGFIRYMSRDFDLYCYTLNKPALAKKWKQHGLSGCVTDRPDLFTTKEIPGL